MPDPPKPYCQRCGSQEIGPDPPMVHFKITLNDKRFLRSLRIKVDPQDSLVQDPNEPA